MTGFNLYSEMNGYRDLVLFDEMVGKKKFLYIEGIFAQADLVNRNGRMYSSNILMPAIDTFVENRVKTSNALGELDHPEKFEVNSHKASHLITKLEKKGPNVHGKARIVNTPTGDIVRGLMDSGVKLGVSTRGAGKSKTVKGVEHMQVFIMSTIDIVTNPSAPDAYVKGINENIEYFVESGIISRELASTMTKKRMSTNEFKRIVSKITGEFDKYGI